MSYKVINFPEKFGLIDEQWQPKVIAEMNDYQFKLVRLQQNKFSKMNSITPSEAAKAIVRRNTEVE